MGLTSRLKVRTGGVQKAVADAPGPDAATGGVDDSLTVPTRAAVGSSEARVERDPQTGAILRVVPCDSRLRNPLNDPLNELSDSAHEPSVKSRPSKGIVKDLEEEASRPPRRRKPPQDLWEKEWVEELVARHGHDYARMMRDRRLNPYQRSEGDIRKRVARWDTSPGQRSEVSATV